MEIEATTNAVYVLDWTEYELGMGQRPDGQSLHLTLQDACVFVEQHWEREKKANGNRVPDIYSKPDIDPRTEPNRIRMVEVSPDIYQSMVEKNSMWAPIRTGK